jgi:hypothetical protein
MLNTQTYCVEIPYLVYDSQMEPRNRYQTISRSLRAYSERSRAADGGGARRRLREMSSRIKAVTNGRLERLLSDANSETVGRYEFTC